MVHEPRWTVRLLGAVEAEGLGQRLSHWPTRATAALLARLALEPGRVHPREELVELLWPGVALEVGRNRLRQALSALKGLLEPRGPRSAPVLQADRAGVRVLPGALACDVRRFERCVRAGDARGARELYRGELMPNFYDEWVVEERRRLAGLGERIDIAAAVPASALSTSLPLARAVVEPPPEAVTPLPSGLPSYWTRTFGAELTAPRLLALVCAQRLVTVHGPGGSGKTRLAVDVAQALRDGQHGFLETGPALPRFDRVAFVPLVDCSDAGQVLDAICAALQAEGTGEPAARIVAALAGRRTLLVLDNFEQVVVAAGAAVVRLLTGLPALHVLVTSRQLLEVDGEHAFELEGLALPAPEAPLIDAAANPAVALFIDRARAVRADFRLSSRNAAAVAGLVRLLGGMPLAIELAASRTRGLSPQELLQRLRQDAGTPMLDLLARSTKRATVDARHASMRHVVGWSWRQLNTSQVALLQALSVFAASAQPEAVAAVAGIDLRRAQSLLDELHDASLLRRVEGRGGDTRFVLLQPVREFAAELMADADACAARQRLRQWLLRFAHDARARKSPAVEQEMAHVQAAILSAPGDGASRQALELAVALRPFWDSDHPRLSVLQALERALAEIGPANHALRCDAHELLAFGRGSAGFGAVAIAHAEAAVAAATDDRRRSIALSRLAWSLYAAGRLDGPLDVLLDEASKLADQAGDLYAQAMVLRMQSLVTCNLKLDYAGAEVLSARNQVLWERLGNQPMAYLSLLNRAMMWGKIGRGNEEAVTVMLECERVARAASDWPGLMTATRQLGRVFIRMRRWDEAAAAFRRSVDVAWRRHSALGLAHALMHLPMALVMCGQAEQAARLEGFGVARWWQLCNGINSIEARELRCARLLIRLRLGAARAETLRVEGRGMTVADAVTWALQDTSA